MPSAKFLEFLKKSDSSLTSDYGSVDTSPWTVDESTWGWVVARTEERVSLSFTIMEEMIIVPKKELPEVVQWYKGELTGNALLERAGRLSAQKKRLLEDPTLDTDEVVQKA